MYTGPLVAAVVFSLTAGCQSHDHKPEQKTNDHGSASLALGSGSAGSAGSASAAAPLADIDSKDILGRTETSPDVYIKHVLLAWKELGAILQGQIDPRAAKRTNAEAAALAQDIAAKLRKDPGRIDELVKQYSEDPNAQNGEPYEIATATEYVPQFKQLALRLKENEVGIATAAFGYDVIQRVAPPPSDPLESADILARPPQAGTVTVQHVMIGWKDAEGAKRLADPRAMKRSKADADKFATEVLAKAKAGEDFVKLMKDDSEDPGSRNSGKSFDIDASSPLPFAKLALRLKDNEVGLIKSPFGWHVVKRLAANQPDPLDSSDILKRGPVTKRAKVKLILLGWKDVHTEDPRGVARDRSTLEKLVKDTVARLKKGEKIEPIMKELSEDPLSAQDGTTYLADAKAELVKPLKDLSLRLQLNEVGVVKSQFGIHIVQRVE